MKIVLTSKNILNILKLFSVLLLYILLTSCSGNYNKYYQNLESSLKNDKIYSFHTIKESNINYLLLNQEAGLYYFLRNNLECSLNHFDNALTAYTKIKENTTSKISKNLTSILASDTLTRYEGSDFEEALIHYYKGLSYLFQNDLNKSLIEFRASENILKFAQELRQKKIISQESNINNMLAQNNLTSKELDALLQLSKEARAENQSKFLNANIIYISGIIKELNKQYNDALVNYKQAYTIQPYNTFLIKDLYRLSLQYDIEYAKNLEKNYPELTKLKYNFKYSPGKNSIYIIYEQGFIPKRKNYKISLIGINDLILSINLPIYNTENKSNSVIIDIPEENIKIVAEETANFYKLARNQLLESYPRIIANQLAKLAIQIASQKAIQAQYTEKKFSIVFGALGLLDSSDLRSWYTLPSSVKIAKIDTEKDINRVLLNINNRIYNLDLSFKNNIILFYIFDTGNKLYTKVLYNAQK